MRLKSRKSSSVALHRRRQKLLHQLPPLDRLLQESLIERYKRYDKPRCKCAHSVGHDPKYYLSVSFPRLRPQMDYVPQELQPQARKGLAHYHRVREILEEICEINRELLRRREAL